MSISVLNLTDYNIDIRRYRRFLKVSLEASSISGDVSLVFVNNDYIKDLNYKFRKKNRPTDVLTFSIDTIDNSGDIVISYEWVLENYGYEKSKKNIYKLIVHSVLHLKGVHHDYTKESLLENNEKMKSLYKIIVKHIKNKKLEI